MSDILEEIQDLSNKFSNLFEVDGDGLGNPAVDVPPSQNKIKRDRRTKDGKVEVVSVEDELFPYDGNKREQYRQKILDTINNMIQGTATLEDLLQIVRQKKAPLKEAMELMEDIRSAIEKKHGKPEYYSGRSPWQVGKEPANKSAELTQKANEIKEKEALQAAERELDKDRPDLKDAHPAKKNYKVADYYGQIMARRNGKAPLKEAMELMEDINNYVRRVHGEPNEVNKSGKLLDKAASIKMREHNKAAGKAAADKLGISMDDEEWWKDENNRKKYQKEFEKQSEEIFKKRKVKNYKTVPNSADFAHGKEWTGEPTQKKAPLKEAMELMEELLLERNKENRDKKEKWELKTNNITKKYKKAIQDYAKQEGDEAKYHRAVAADYDHIYSQQPAKAPDGSPNSVAAYFNDKYQEMLRNKGRNEQNIADEVEPLTKKLKNRKHSFHDRVRGWTESEALEEAMKVLEELIGEGRNLEDVVVRGYNKGKVPLDDLQKLMDKAHEVPSDSSYFHKSKGEKGELRTKHRHMDYERNVLSDGWGKDDNKKIEASIKRKAKNDKSFPVFQALKAYKEGKANVKEALEIMEAIINEVSERTKIDAYKKRVAQHTERAEHDRNMANEYAKMGGYDHAIDFLKDADASQKKEFKHRLRTMTHDKKFGQDAYNKAQKELFDEWKAKKNIKEALSLTEEIINEVSERTKIDAYKKRVAQHTERAEHDRNMANEYAKMGGYDHAIDFLKDADASQKKEFKHRLRTMTHDKKFGQDAYNKAQKELFDEWKAKKNIKEALSLTEEIINEVSVKKWKEAAKNSIEGRKEAASDASDRFGEVVYPFRGEVNDPGHKLGNAWDKAEQRADRAEQLAKNLPDSNRSATKLKQAAKKVVDKRDKDNEEAVDKLQGAVDKFKEKPYDERTDKDYSDLAKVQNEWVGKQKKENQARNLVGKPERRPEKNSEGKHKLKEQGFIDRSNEA